ncbi:MAG: hypothetical protein IKR85_02905 [Clostridia bacterium]|nr:hypothetical protein [Clostridia bacterium]
MKKGIGIEYAFSTGVHEITHHADNVMGFPAENIVKTACKRLRNEYSGVRINRLKAETAAEKWEDPHELLAYSMEKYCVGKGNVLAQEIATEFLKRCKKK